MKKTMLLVMAMLLMVMVTPFAIADMNPAPADDDPTNTLVDQDRHTFNGTTKNLEGVTVHYEEINGKDYWRFENENGDTVGYCQINDASLNQFERNALEDAYEGRNNTPPVTANLNCSRTHIGGGVYTDWVMSVSSN